MPADVTPGAPAGALAGPDFLIEDSVGLRTGGNQFYRFGVFHVHVGECVTLTQVAPALIERVLNRVVGGAASSIDGRIASAIAGADLNFSSAAGIVFGEHASLDVPPGVPRRMVGSNTRTARGARYVEHRQIVRESRMVAVGPRGVGGG